MMHFDEMFDGSGAKLKRIIPVQLKTEELLDKYG